MLQRKLLWAFVVLVVMVVAIGLFTLQATTSTSQDFNYLVDHTASTLHTLSHLRAATARLMLEAERLVAQEENTQADTFERAQGSFEEALAEYEVVATSDDNGAHLAGHIGLVGRAVLFQANTLREDLLQGRANLALLEADLGNLRGSEQQLTRYLEEAIAVESGELEQGDFLADRAAAGRRQLAILLTGAALILAVVFGTFLFRQAGIEAEVQARLQRAKAELEQEVTTRTRYLEEANQALAHSEERFRVAAEEALVGIYVIQDDRLRYVNPMMAHFFGYDPDQLTDTISPLSLIVPEDRAGVAEKMQQRLSGIAAEAPHCFRGLHRDGHELLLESIGRRIQFQGQPAIIGSMLEVTERERTAAEIARRNRELQALLTISQRLAGEFGMEERLQTITDAIVETIPGAQAASLWLHDEGREQLALRSWSGYGADEVASLRAPTEEVLAWLVSGTPQPRLVSGRKSEPEAPGVGDNETRPVLGVPILLEGNLVGVIVADSLSAIDSFDQHDLRLLRAVAGEAAIAIKNAQLLQATRQHQQELRQLSQQLLAAREAEASRISQELHDVIGQALTAISINLAEVKRTLPAESVNMVQERLQESEMLTTQTLNQVRELSLELRPSMLDELGLLPTLRWYLHRFGRRLNIPVSLDARGLNGRMAPEIETILYRAIQEGLTNVARHAQATSVEVNLHCTGRQLEIAIEDDGVGFEPAAVFGNDGEHMGLLGMRERVALLGGSLQIDAVPEQGTRLLIHLPCLTRRTAVTVEPAHDVSELP